MQPKSKHKLDSDTFNRLKRKLKNITITGMRKKENPSYATNLPEEIGIQLTYRCNLRCNHCFQWNNKGFFFHLKKEKQDKELDFYIIEKAMKETEPVKSNLYLWGGEPLVYHYWDLLANLLEKDRRWTVICTNGVLIDKKMETILRISESTVLLVSLDGFQEGNDEIRGKGTFKKVMENISLLFELKKKGLFKGLISINAVLNDSLIPVLYDFTCYLNSFPIDTLYISYNWYITDKMASEMDSFYRSNFPFLKTLPDDYIPSWHSFKYSLNPDLITTLQNEIKKIMKQEWDIRVRFQPPIEESEIENFVTGYEETSKCKNECLSLNYRIDILSDGNVSGCKLFPEFCIGSLKERSLKQIWQSDIYRQLRETIAKGLTPICKRCVLLYLHGK